MSNFIITLDGPGGSGKTTLAKILAKELNITYLDTGAMYRGVGYFCQQRGLTIGDEESVRKIINDIDLVVMRENGEQKVIVNGDDVTPYIRTPEISMWASFVGKVAEVRLKLVEIQRKLASLSSCVLDGRDIGSYVLPDAEFKFYLSADVEERAKRRYIELKEKGKEDITLESVKEDMIARDKQDSERAFAPLCVPEGAYVIDTTNLTIEEVLDIILNKVRK
jgi:cytidylate kinase